jgi:N4-gp56 family major capsid protein
VYKTIIYLRIYCAFAQWKGKIMAITTTSVLSAPVQQSFAHKLLSVPVPNLIHNLAADRKVMPRNGGTTLRMRRYNPLPTSLVPLGNSGITPPATVATAIDIDAKMSFYGQYIIVNEQVTLQDQDPVLNELTLRLGVSLRQSEDELTRNMLAATAGFINCTGGTNGDSPTEITRSDVDDVITALMDANAYTIMNMIGGEDKFGKKCAEVKLSLIDLEAYGESYGDRAQA